MSQFAAKPAVLFLINHAGKGGTEKYIELFAGRLVRDGSRVFLVYNEKGPLVDHLQELGIETIHMEMKSRYDWLAAWKLKSICVEKKIDIVHTQFLRENYIAAIARQLGNKPVLANTIHMINPPAGRVLVPADRWAISRNGIIIAVSNAAKKRIVEQHPMLEDRIHVVHNGIDIGLFDGRRKTTGLGQFGLMPGDLVILSIGRFSEEKGHGFMIDSIQKFYERSDAALASKVKFLLVGDGPAGEACRETVNRLGLAGKVIFTGYYEDVGSLLRESDIFVSHSRSEALGISILEAMACRLPVIATDSGGPAEILGEKNEWGILVDYGDTESLAGAMEQLALDSGLRSILAEKAFERVSKNYSLDHMVDQTYALYQNALAKEQIKEF